MEEPIKNYTAGFPGTLYAGQGSIRRMQEILDLEGAKNVVVLMDSALEGLPEVQDFLKESGPRLAGVVKGLPIEPTRDSIRKVYDSVIALNGDLLAAIGGGSVMDMTKVVAAAACNEPFADSGFKDTSLIRNASLPTVMIPTTAGTGAEATPNAIFLEPEQELKVGVVSPQFVASYVILDASLTRGLPPALTASTGLDALCHAVESCLSKKANPVSKVFAHGAAALIGANLERTYQDGTDMEAREGMQLGAFLAGMCLSSSTTVAVHALSYPLGGKYHISHGISNAILLPGVLRANLPSCREEYRELADIMMPFHNFTEEEKPERFVEYITGLCERLGIPKSLKEFGIEEEDVDILAENAMQVKRLLDQNPHPLSKQEIGGIYRSLLCEQRGS